MLDLELYVFFTGCARREVQDQRGRMHARCYLFCLVYQPTFIMLNSTHVARLFRHCLSCARLDL